ncbi:MAG TPA: c-type cytochrome [candidate division Zixibacteria bacterium]|nr:c-type cytochrome [candidate division Zixibacteria bacterium]
MTVHTPIETRSRGLPAWAIGITALVLLAGAVYVGANLTGENPPIAQPSGSAAPSGASNEQLALQIITDSQCGACHGQDLTGGVGPDLHGIAAGPKSENLQDLAAEHPDEWIFLWIQGTDPAVADLDRGGMPAFGETLSDEEIQVVVDYLLTLE